MSAESMVWRVIGIAVVLLTAAVPAYVAYDLYGRGPAPEKHVELTRITPINPLADLSPLGDRVSIVVTVDEQTIDNIVIAQAYFRNSGSTPILPSDYHENLSVTVQEPWKIVAVENQRLSGRYVPLRWKRVEDRKFEAEAALLNPGDWVAVRVYLTNADFVNRSVFERRAEPGIEWNARITNLRAFSEPPDPAERIERKFGGIVVFLSGWAVPFMIATAVLFQVLYLHLLARAEFLKDWSWRMHGDLCAIDWIVIVTLVSFVAAKGIATYLFGDFWTDIVGVQHHLNAPPIIVHAALLGYLWWKARTGPVGRTV